MKTTTLQKTMQAFGKARAISAIKPVLQGININEDQTMLACTDSFRLHAMQYIVPKGYQLPTGTYNPETLEIYPEIESYPDYMKIAGTDTHTLQHAGSLQAFKETVIKSPITDIKQGAITLYGKEYKQKYINEAIAFLEHFTLLTKEKNIEVYSKDTTAPLAIKVVSTYSENDTRTVAFALIMPLNK